MNKLKNLNLDKNQLLNLLFKFLIWVMPVLCGVLNQIRMLFSGQIRGIYVFVNPPEYLYPLLSIDVSWWLVLVIGTTVLLGVSYISKQRAVSRGTYPLYIYLIFLLILVRPIPTFPAVYFDQQQWVQSQLPSDLRHQMVDDLIANSRLVGMTTDEIFSLLGNPNEGNINGIIYGPGEFPFIGWENFCAYEISSIKNPNGQKKSWLVIFFEDGKVSRSYKQSEIIR